MNTQTGDIIPTCHKTITLTLLLYSLYVIHYPTSILCHIVTHWCQKSHPHNLKVKFSSIMHNLDSQEMYRFQTLRGSFIFVCWARYKFDWQTDCTILLVEDDRLNRAIIARAIYRLNSYWSIFVLNLKELRLLTSNIAAVWKIYNNAPTAW